MRKSHQRNDSSDDSGEESLLNSHVAALKKLARGVPAELVNTKARVSSANKGHRGNSLAIERRAELTEQGVTSTKKRQRIESGKRKVANASYQHTRGSQQNRTSSQDRSKYTLTKGSKAVRDSSQRGTNRSSGTRKNVPSSPMFPQRVAQAKKTAQDLTH